MAAPIEFYFDFSSPYSYLASESIEALAARYGRTVEYKPILLGAAFKVSGLRPLTDIPLKGEYSRRDFERSARFAGVPFVMPDPFPISSVAAARAALWIADTDPDRARAFVHAALRAFFAQGRNIADTVVLADVLRRVGVDPERAKRLLSSAERYCSTLQTLRHGVEVATTFDLG